MAESVTLLCAEPGGRVKCRYRIVWSVRPRPINGLGAFNPDCRAIFADSIVPAERTTVRAENVRSRSAR